MLLTPNHKVLQPGSWAFCALFYPPPGVFITMTWKNFVALYRRGRIATSSCAHWIRNDVYVLRAQCKFVILYRQAIDNIPYREIRKFVQIRRGEPSLCCFGMVLVIFCIPSHINATCNLPLFRDTIRLELKTPRRRILLCVIKICFPPSV